jgi:hypothetical protein
MRAWLTPLSAILLLSGCGTDSFRPVEYPLRSSLITPFDVSGKVAVGNAQTSNESATIYSYGSTTIKGNLSTITEVMVRQSAKEIEAAGRKIGGDGTKIIGLRVDSLESESHVVYYKSKMLFQVTLGDGQVLNLSAAHASNSADSDLNGCIADGVLALLQDDRVRSYLASELQPPPPRPLEEPPAAEPADTPLADQPAPTDQSTLSGQSPPPDAAPAVPAPDSAGPSDTPRQ